MVSFSSLDEYMKYEGYILIAEIEKSDSIPCDVYFGFKHINKDSITNCTALPYKENIHWYSSGGPLAKGLTVRIGIDYVRDMIKNFHPIPERLFRRLNMMENAEEIRQIKKMLV